MWRSIDSERFLGALEVIVSSRFSLYLLPKQRIVRPDSWIVATLITAHAVGVHFGAVVYSVVWLFFYLSFYVTFLLIEPPSIWNVRWLISCLQTWSKLSTSGPSLQAASLFLRLVSSCFSVNSNWLLFGLRLYKIPFPWSLTVIELLLSSSHCLVSSTSALWYVYASLHNFLKDHPIW